MLTTAPECKGRAVIRIAGSLELDELIDRLRASRPVFHSEADLQHELAWQAHLLDPDLQVRLEIRPNPELRERLDVALSRRDLGQHTAIEIKYLTAHWSGEAAGERYNLLNQGAQDITRYDVIKDITIAQPVMN